MLHILEVQINDTSALPYFYQDREADRGSWRIESFGTKLRRIINFTHDLFTPQMTLLRSIATVDYNCKSSITSVKRHTKLLKPHVKGGRLRFVAVKSWSLPGKDSQVDRGRPIELIATNVKLSNAQMIGPARQF